MKTKQESYMQYRHNRRAGMLAHDAYRHMKLWRGDHLMTAGRHYVGQMVVTASGRCVDIFGLHWRETIGRVANGIRVPQYMLSGKCSG